MPELPEVETVCRGLASQVTGQQLREVLVRRPDLRFPIPVSLRDALTGRTVQSVSRRAKYILMRLDGGVVFLSHLGMTGKWLYHPAMPELKTHDHVVMTLGSGAALVFNDARRFGFVDLAEEVTLEQHPYFVHLGPEPLGNGFSGAYLHGVLKGRKQPIKLAIMDQRLVVGVGNIYASEALFRSRIHPEIPAGKLSLAQCEALVVAIREVLTAAIASGGSTLRDYVRSSGDVGYFQHQFAVYGRAGEPCAACGGAVQKVVQGGRSTFFCGRCQKR